MEMRTKSNRELYNKALRKLEDLKYSCEDYDWHKTLLTAMNPQKLSFSEIQILKDIIEGV